KAISLREQITHRPTANITDVSAEEKWLSEADDQISRLKFVADFLAASEFTFGNETEVEAARVDLSLEAASHFQHSSNAVFAAAAANVLNGQNPFHWPLEFPEVFSTQGGFDAVVGNPPFMWGMRLSTYLGNNYLRYLEATAGASLGTADLCVHF